MQTNQLDVAPKGDAWGQSHLRSVQTAHWI